MSPILRTVLPLLATTLLFGAGCAAADDDDLDDAVAEVEAAATPQQQAERLFTEAVRTARALNRNEVECADPAAIVKKLRRARALRPAEPFRKRIAANLELKQALLGNIAWAEITGELRVVTNPEDAPQFEGLAAALRDGVTFHQIDGGALSGPYFRFTGNRVSFHELRPAGEGHRWQKTWERGWTLESGPEGTYVLIGGAAGRRLQFEKIPGGFKLHEWKAAPGGRWTKMTSAAAQFWSYVIPCNA